MGEGRCQVPGLGFGDFRDAQPCSVITAPPPKAMSLYHLLFFLTTQERGQQLFPILKFRGQVAWHLLPLSQEAGPPDVELQGRNGPSSLTASVAAQLFGTPLSCSTQSLPWHSPVPVIILASWLPPSSLSSFSLTDTEATSGEGASQSSEYFSTSWAGGDQALGMESSCSFLPRTAFEKHIAGGQPLGLEGPYEIRTGLLKLSSIACIF